MSTILWIFLCKRRANIPIQISPTLTERTLHINQLCARKQDRNKDCWCSPWTCPGWDQVGCSWVCLDHALIAPAVHVYEYHSVVM